MEGSDIKKVFNILESAYIIAVEKLEEEKLTSAFHRIIHGWTDNEYSFEDAVEKLLQEFRDSKLDWQMNRKKDKKLSK